MRWYRESDVRQSGHCWSRPGDPCRQRSHREKQFDETIPVHRGRVGRPKCEVLARELRSRNSAVEISLMQRRIINRADLDTLTKADLIVLSADSPGITELVNAHCVTTGQVWLNVCYVNDIAVWGPLVIPGVTGCWACQRLTARDSSGNTELDILVSRINSRYQSPSHGSTNMPAAALASLDVLKYLGGFGSVQSLNRRVGLWTHELRLDEQSSPRNPECPASGSMRASSKSSV